MTIPRATLDKLEQRVDQVAAKGCPRCSSGTAVVACRTDEELEQAQEGDSVCPDCGRLVRLVLMNPRDSAVL